MVNKETMSDNEIESSLPSSQFQVGDFALGISQSIQDIDQCLQSIDGSGFQCIEIPGTWLESPGAVRKINNSPLHIVGVTNLIESSVSASIADYNENIQQGFIEKLVLMMDNLADLQVDRFSIDTGFEAIYNNPEKVLQRVSLLKNIAPYLYRKNINLVIPVRIPSVSAIQKGKYASLLRNSMCSNIKLALHIHPHETIKMGTPAELLEEFRFFIDSISFVYEPEAGNSLVTKLVEPWFEALEKLDYQGMVVLHPRVSNLDNMITSLRKLSHFL